MILIIATKKVSAEINVSPMNAICFCLEIFRSGIKRKLKELKEN